MTKDVFFHAGLAKTGTTYIQKFCKWNQKNLAEQGVLYPENGRGHPNHILHNSLAAAYRHTPPNWLERLFGIANIPDVLKEIENFSGDTVFFSSEFLQGATKIRQLSEDFNEYNINFLLYMRNQADYVNSNYAQSVKMGLFTGTPEEFFEKTKNGLIYTHLIKKFVEKSRDQGVILFSYDDLIDQGGILPPLLDLLGAKWNDKMRDIPRQNESIDRYSLAWLRGLAILTSRELTGPAWTQVRDRLPDSVRNAGYPIERFEIGGNFRAHIMNETVRGNLEVAERFGRGPMEKLIRGRDCNAPTFNRADAFISHAQFLEISRALLEFDDAFYDNSIRELVQWAIQRGPSEWPLEASI